MLKISKQDWFHFENKIKSPKMKNTILFHVLAFLALASHAAAMLTDPG